MSGARWWKTNRDIVYEDRWKPRRRERPWPDPLTATLDATDDALHAWGATTIRYTTHRRHGADLVVCSVETTTTDGTVLTGRSQLTGNQAYGFLEAAAQLLRGLGEEVQRDPVLHR